MHAYEVRPRKDHRGVDLISDGEAVKLILDCPADVWLLSAVKRAVERHCPCRQDVRLRSHSLPDYCSYLLS
jgi:hypothetical protein